jgi:hypothetical protein
MSADHFLIGTKNSEVSEVTVTYCVGMDLLPGPFHVQRLVKCFRG